MADLVITAANVRKGAGADVENGIGGVVLTAGQTVYKDQADNKFRIADADAVTAAVRTTRGIALNGCAVDQPLAVQKDRRIVIGATVVPGTIYVQSDTPGGIMPSADLESGDFVTIVGVGVSTTEIELFIRPSGVAVP